MKSYNLRRSKTAKISTKIEDDRLKVLVAMLDDRSLSIVTNQAWLRITDVEQGLLPCTFSRLSGAGMREGGRASSLTRPAPRELALMLENITN